MNRRTLLLGIAALLVTLVLAFFLEDVIRRVIITPLAYLAWLIGLLYSAIPQLLLWILLLAGMLLIALTSLVRWLYTARRFEEPVTPSQGPVEILARWVANTQGKGLYYKWMVANRLGKLWREINGGAADPSLLEKVTSSKPQAARRYLKAGLDESFVDYPAPALPFQRRSPTPFDLDVKEAVDYLEEQMEANNGKEHS